MIFGANVRGSAGIRAALAWAAVSFIGASARADLTVNSWRLTSEALVADGEGVAQDDSVTQNAGGDSPAPVLPYLQTDDAIAVAGVSASSSVYDFSTSGDDGVFSFGFEHLSDFFMGSYATSEGTVVFTPAVDSTFTLTGGYIQTGFGTILMDVSLSEFGGDPIFSNSQLSIGESGETFALGGSDGNTANVNDGALTGSLSGGMTYRLLYEFRIEGAGGDEGFSAIGDLGLRVTAGTVAVPLPSAVALAALGLCLMPRRRNRPRA
jgi:hypothetical protein